MSKKRNKLEKLKKMKEERFPVIEECGRCKNIQRVISGDESVEIIQDVCKTFYDPTMKWKMSMCPRLDDPTQIIVKKCQTCGNVTKQMLCVKIRFPGDQWDEKDTNKTCPEYFKIDMPGGVNPLKASKRGARR